MPFTPKNWEDAPSTNTPINAVALEDLETRVTDYTDDEVATRAAASHDHVAADVTDFDTQVRTSRLDQMAVPTAEVNANSQQIGGLITPVDDDHAARKKYVDDQDAAVTAFGASALTTHTGDTTSVHGIADTTAITHSNIAAANKDGAAATASMRTLGTGAAQAAAGNDSRFNSNSTTYLTLDVMENPSTGTSATTYTASPFGNSVMGYNLTAAGFSIWSSRFVVPADWVSGMTIRMYVASTSAGDVRMGAQAVPLADGESATASMTTGAAAATFTLAANNIKVVDLSPSNTPAAGEVVFVRVYRDGDNAGDTNAALAYLMGLAFVYTGRV